MNKYKYLIILKRLPRCARNDTRIGLLRFVGNDTRTELPRFARNDIKKYLRKDDYFSLIFFAHSEDYPNSIEVEFDLLSPLHNNHSLTKIIFPSQIQDLRILPKPIKVYVKDGVFSLIDVQESVRRTADLMKILQA